MTDHLTVDVVDTDVAFREALDESSQATRAGFLQKALVAGGVIAAGGVVLGGLPKLVTAAPSPSQDIQILNFALLLEYLEAEFYAEALRNGALSGETRSFAQVTGAHEQAHVDFLRKALGSRARSKPTFDFKDTTRNQAKFQATAVLLEDTGVAAYNGQAQNLTKKTLAAAATIVSVEGRHAAWIRDIIAQNPAPNAFDPLKTKAQIEAAVGQTGFIKAS